MTRTTTQLKLAIELDSDPISGSVSDGTQSSRPFNGWIELVAAIEAARNSRPASGGSESRGKTLGALPGAKVCEV